MAGWSPWAGLAASLVLVALSGGADSLALAAAVAFEAPRAGLRAGAVIVDHGLQTGSADVATTAAAQARALGLDPVTLRQVQVGTAGGPEAAARDARYAALADEARTQDAAVVLLAHTLDDQAETVLLGLARGSGAVSLMGMDESTTHTAAGATVFARPLLGIRRSTTAQFCADSGLTPWHDPHNVDLAFARVRVRTEVLPVLERELGPGVVEALARTAEQLREDADALGHFAAEQVEELAEHAEAGLSLSVAGLAANPAALRQRIIRSAVLAEFGVSLSRTHTLAVAALVTDWRGQGPIDVPGVRVSREGARLVFRAADAYQHRLDGARQDSAHQDSARQDSEDDPHDATR
ncbi:MAG TPA: tRNA lysidine(34) synthetase TilS [Terrimesophilobacter sp.]|nr:tRNA lysidine(34) synthetase TilS [Terrimesophilobacter sp.]